METTAQDNHFTAFGGTCLIGSGSLREVATRAWEYLERGGMEPLAIFEDSTGNAVEIDLRGSLEDALSRLPSGPAEPEERRTGPGRPKLGVVSREVSLLPRHWEWLASQPGGASVALRKLVEVARKDNAGKDRVRRCRDAAHKFMWSMAGDFEGFEEATRAFFAGDYTRFDALTQDWPPDVRDHARRLVQSLDAAERAAELPEPVQAAPSLRVEVKE
jgi:uncharacterized protein